MNLLQTSLRSIAFSIMLLPAIHLVAFAAESAPTAVGPQTVNAVARVNGREISAAQLKRAVDALSATQPEAKLAADTLKKVNTNVLNDLIAQELIYQGGLKLEIKDLDNLVREKIAQERAKYVNEEFFQKALSSKNMTKTEFYDAVRHEVVIKNFTKSIDAKLSVSDEECKKAYDLNIEQFTQPEQVRVSHILIATDTTMSAEEKKKAREKAEEIRKELLNGAGFVEMARKYSSAPSSKLGGDLGYMAKAEMPSSFGQAAFALKPGEISEIVESKAGYDIIKMRDRRGATTTPFEKAKPQIEDYLRKLKFDWAIQEYLKDAHEKAKIEVLLK